MGTEKRRDRKGRILKNGESERADGRYAYVYTDYSGKQNFIYSWKLEPTDPLPKGKRKCLSLREKERKILKQIESGLRYNEAQVTVMELVEKYISLKTGVKSSTRAGYGTVINVLKEETAFSDKMITDIKISDAKEFLIYLQDIKGKGYSSIHSIRGVLRPAFQMAVDDDLLPKNPFEFQLVSVIVDDSKTREALTKKQENSFLEFIKHSKEYKKYYEGMYILFNTGLRISEFVGLTTKDIDMENKTINVDHQLQRNMHMEYEIVDSTKTKYGMRTLPMTEEVYECFRTIMDNRPKPKKEPSIKGYKGFLYLDKNEMPVVALHWEKHFEYATKRYNSLFKEELPPVTPHVCRHTYCTNMAKKGMNPKALQYLMGHSDISITLNIYTHLKYDDAKKEWDNILEKNEIIDLDD